MGGQRVSDDRGDLGFEPRRDENIGRLEVAVEDWRPAGVKKADPPRHPPHNAEQVVALERHRLVAHQVRQAANEETLVIE